MGVGPGQGDLMSKAFVKETDEEADLPDEPPAIPPGVKNYMTPEGHRRMQDELRQLLRVERPKVVETVAWAAGNGDRSENGDYIYGKRRLRETDRRIRFLSKRLERAEVVDPNQQKKRDQVFFGATVTYATGRGTEMTITIVKATSSNSVRRRESSKSRCSPFAMTSPIQDRLSNQPRRLRQPLALWAGGHMQRVLAESLICRGEKPDRGLSRKGAEPDDGAGADRRRGTDGRGG
jgi:transcription elongation factor GreB